MVALNFLAGGFVNFIATYLFDSDAKTLTVVAQNPTGANPSWIERFALDPSFLIATNENDPGVIQTFKIQPNGTLGSPISNTETGGSAPTHILSTSDGTISTMNFGGGNGAIFQADSSLNFGQKDFIAFPAGAAGPSTPHQTVQYQDELLVLDRDGDTIWRLTKTDGHYSIMGEIKQNSGSGPRHAVISNDILFTLHEKDNTLTSQKIPQLGSTNISSILSSASIVPTDPPVVLKDFAAAELLFPKVSSTSDFTQPFLYASNRNTGTSPDARGDSIAIFSFDSDGVLKLVNQVFTGLVSIRGMQFGGPDDRYLVASGLLQSGGVVVFERTEGGANLVEVVRNTQIPNLSTFVWL